MERRPVAAAAWEAASRQLPPGFRFHPTDEELVVQYLRRKALSRPLPAAVIPLVHDAARLDPWDLPGASEGETYFFGLRQTPASGRVGRWRRAGSGYWKATGKEKPVFLQGSGCGSKQQLVGVKTALAFHRAKAPSSRTDWVMHEYRLAVTAAAPRGVAEQKKSTVHSFTAQPGEWVVCRVSLKNRARRPAGSTGNHAAAVHRQDGGHHLQQSSSSCVIDVSDQEEVSSVGSSMKDAAPAASEREA